MQRDETPLAVSGVDTGRLATVCIPGGTGTNCTFDNFYKEEFLEMKNLKKVLALVLAMSTVFGLSVSAGAAATDFNDYDEIQNKEAVEVMNALNVIGGNDKGDFNPDGYLTRAEMCKMVSFVMNGGNAPVLGTSSSYTYTDTAYSWAKDYIEYATSMGIVGGVGGGKFNPDGSLTGVQAAKMMLVAMGYDANVFGFGGTGWDVNVNRYANEAGLYNGLSDMQPNLPITRDQAAQLMYNAILAGTVTKEWSQDMQTGEISQHYALNKEKDLLGEKFDGEIDLGYLTGYSYDATKAQWTYTFESDKDYFGGKAIALDDDGIGSKTIKSKTDYTGFYGQQVKVIYNTEKNDVLYGVYENDSSVVATGASGDLSDYSNVADTVTVSGKDYKLKDDATKLYVYNTNKLSEPPVTLDTLKNDVSAYEFKLVDNTGDGKVDAAIRTPMSVAKINYVGQDQVQFTVFETNKMPTAAIDIDDLTAYEGYAVGDWVYFTNSAYSSTGLHTIEKAELKTGTVDAIRGNSTVDLYTEYQLGGNWYKEAIDAYKLDDAEVGDSVEYVTLGSTVFSMQIVQSSFNTRDIALVVSVGVENTNTSNISDKTMKAKLLFGDGTTSTVTLDEYNGVAVDAFKYEDANKDGTTGDSESITVDGTPTTVKAHVDSAVGNLVSFRVDGGYELTKISDTNKMGFRDYVDSTDLDLDGTAGLDTTGTGYIDGKIAGELLADDALIFVLADNETPAYDGTTQIQPGTNNKADLYTGKEFKNEFGSQTCTDQFRGQVLTTVQNGFDYVKVAVICMNKLPDITVGSNYGYLTQGAYRTEGEDGKWYLNFTLWTSEGEVTGKYQTNAAPSEYPAGTLISYDLKAEGEFKNVSKSTYVSTAVTAWDADKGNIKFSDGISSEIDTNSTQVIYVDSVKNTGSKGGAIQIAADMDNDGKGDQYNVLYIGNSNKVAVLVVDINNKMDLSKVCTKSYGSTELSALQTSTVNADLKGYNVTLDGNYTLTGNLYVPAGRTLTVNGTLTLNGMVVDGAGKVVATNYTFGSTIRGDVTIIGNGATVTNAMTIEGNANVTIKGDITGSAKLTIAGKANVSVTGTSSVAIVINGSANVALKNHTGSIENNSTGTVTNGGETVKPYSVEKDTKVRSAKVVK